MVTVCPREDPAHDQSSGRGGGTRTLTITPQLDKNTGADGSASTRGWIRWSQTVSPGSAAAIAGLRPGDRILQAGDGPVLNSMDLDQALADRPAKLRVTYDRGGVTADSDAGVQVR